MGIKWKRLNLKKEIKSTIYGLCKSPELGGVAEMRNFVRVLSILIEQDSFCKKVVEIVNENNESLV